jgi:TRAP-type C4-dicarboxylate transport system substrate-binding protein
MKLRGIALGAALTLAMAGTAAAQDNPVHLKLGHWVPPAHPLQKAMEEWGASVQKASNGTITFQVYPAQQLGKAPDHYDMARDGIADVTYINPGYQPGRFPIIAAGELPFLMTNATGGSVALDKWYRKYAATEMKDVKFCLAFVHDPGALHSKKKIETPAEIKGMKIRPAHATMASFVTLLGGTNVQASAPEAREVLERGVADAITFPWGSILLFKIDSVTKFHMDVPLYATTFAWVMNKAKYDSMSPNQKKVIDAHCSPEWAEKVATPWAAYEAAGRDKLRNANGHTVYKLTDAQVAAWRKAAEPLTQIWADNIKKANVGDPDKILKELKDELTSAKAGL